MMTGSRQAPIRSAQPEHTSSFRSIRGETFKLLLAQALREFDSTLREPAIVPQ
jgi:hypothetical protein